MPSSRRPVPDPACRRSQLGFRGTIAGRVKRQLLVTEGRLVRARQKAPPGQVGSHKTSTTAALAGHLARNSRSRRRYPQTCPHSALGAELQQTASSSPSPFSQTALPYVQHARRTPCSRGKAAAWGRGRRYLPPPFTGTTRIQRGARR